MDIREKVFSRIKRVWGRNLTIGTAWEHLYEFSQDIDIRTIMGAGFVVDYSSSSALDVAVTGTGARTIIGYGLDVNYKEVFEVVAMNGQTVVTGTQKFLRFFGMCIATHGSLNKNVGDIYAVKTGTGGTYTTGVPGTITSGLAKMLAAEGSAISGFYTVPAGKTLKLKRLSYGNYTQACRLGIFAQKNTGDDLSMGLEYTM